MTLICVCVCVCEWVSAGLYLHKHIYKHSFQLWMMGLFIHLSLLWIVYMFEVATSVVLLSWKCRAIDEVKSFKIIWVSKKKESEEKVSWKTRGMKKRERKWCKKGEVWGRESYSERGKKKTNERERLNRNPQINKL